MTKQPPNALRGLLFLFGCGYLRTILRMTSTISASSTSAPPLSTAGIHFVPVGPVKPVFSLTVVVTSASGSVFSSSGSGSSCKPFSFA